MVMKPVLRPENEVMLMLTSSQLISFTKSEATALLPFLRFKGAVFAILEEWQILQRAAGFAETRSSCGGQFFASLAFR
jgi:hypothetical protein